MKLKIEDKDKISKISNNISISFHIIQKPTLLLFFSGLSVFDDSHGRLVLYEKNQ